MKKSRLGADPLAWIANTTGNTGEKPEEEVEERKEAVDRREKKSRQPGPRKAEKVTGGGPAAGQERKKDLPTEKHKQSLQDKQNKQGLQASNVKETGVSGGDGDGDGGLHRKQGLQGLQSNARDRKSGHDEDTTRKGLKDGWTRATFIVREEHAEKIRRVAWWERKKVTDVIEEALGAYLRKKRPGEE